MIELSQLARIIDIEYHDVLAGACQIYHDKLRAHLIDGSFVDVWFSRRIPGRFSYHWERRHVDGTMYRHDNFPDMRWRDVSTFPKHFHERSQTKVSESSIDNDPVLGLRQFMNFVRNLLSERE